ncbi:putative peptide chain release factor-like protein, mitochondrial [Lachnellula hyalina]|uniref:Putative peptide chain release factor-like protein, mitochondrial n=1 Tax=Lachnellula hyalina TaxID=1316788 RepID=A0A8H8R5X1_9HELO|nr:putative peptide chain release factor-like protein, mitochondrial [Lachnellula hyalina]TVY29043.1 putative peptide chain release factor-like protein, mitochondrial [Lachnellula hyalina]
MLQEGFRILRRSLVFDHALTKYITKCSITTTSAKWVKKMPDRPKPPPEDEFTEVFLHGSGPGGQKINKTSSAVQLKHLPTGLVLKVQEHRSRTQNRKLARQMLADRLDVMERGSESRVAVKGEVKRKKKSSATKKSKRKYRRLEEEKSGELEGPEDDDLVEEDTPEAAKGSEGRQ